MQLAFLPSSLRLFLQTLQFKRSRSDDSLKHAMIEQAIVKITRKSHTPPLLTAFGVTLSHLSGSAQLIHNADKLGISASYPTINNFDKNAALVCTDDIGTRCDGSNVNSCTWATDNVNFMKYCWEDNV